LRQACSDAGNWPGDIKIAVNLSAVQFGKGDLVDTVSRALSESGLPPQRLELEITESVLLHSNDDNIAILAALKSLGVSIVLDDFGTGYSSLSYLRMFSFDKIKIDRAFIINLDRNPQSAAIVRAVIGLGRGLQLPVVAEGVETEPQLAFLSQEACDEVQGYLIGRPDSIDKYAELVGRPPEPGRVQAAQAG